MYKKIVFIGGVGSSKQFGGELTKNKTIIKKFISEGFTIKKIDTYKSRTSWHKKVKILLLFLYYHFLSPKSIFIYSTSPQNVYPLLKIMYYTPIIKHRIILWVIGGNFGKYTQERRFKLKYLKQIYLILVEGNKMKQELKSCGIENALVVPNFKQHINITPDKYTDGRIHFLFLSRIMPEKGVSYILDCVERLNNNYKEKFEVDFYGNIDNSYKEEFNARISVMDNVHYRNELNLNETQGYKILSRYQFMLFPTYWRGEGFPGVIIDSYIAGVPIIASNWNFNEEFIIHNVTGLLVPTHDINSLYKSMENVILLKYDISRMSYMCQSKAIEYSVDNVISSKLIHKISQ